MREIERGVDWLHAYLFKVTPAMKWHRMQTYRKGRLLHDPVHGPMPHRLRMRVEDGTFLRQRPRAIYTYREGYHTTAFVIASCSDLKTMMARGNRKMREEAEKTLKYLQRLKPSSTTHAQEIRESIDKAREIIRLFKPEEDDRFEVETYLFPSDKFGEIKEMGEMRGSQRRTLDPKVPFASVGYRVIGLPKLPLHLEVEVVI